MLIGIDAESIRLTSDMWWTYFWTKSYSKLLNKRFYIGSRHEKIFRVFKYIKIS